MCTTRACVCASNLYVLYFICIIFLIFIILFSLFLFFFFFFNDTATTEIYTSFPTRRSSDLPEGAAACPGGAGNPERQALYLPVVEHAGARLLRRGRDPRLGRAGHFPIPCARRNSSQRDF